MTENLFIESRISLSEWGELFAPLLAKKEINDVKLTITEFSQKRLLVGEKAKILPDQLLARIISFDRFCRLLVKLRHYATLREAKEDVQFRIDLKLSSVDKRWKSLEIGRYIMWSTLDASSNGPFWHKIAKDELICSLGLNPIPSLVLLLEYKLPKTVDAKVPTFFDAYSGLVWSKYFYRVESHEPYGMTVPTKLCPVAIGHPEVVHKVIKAENLTSPLKTI